MPVLVTTYLIRNNAAAKSIQSCLTPCDPIDGSPPGSPVPGTLQARTLQWVAISFSNAWKWKVKVKSLSRVWLFATPKDCSPPGSSVHGILQARVLEWGATAFHEKQCYYHLNQGLTIVFCKRTDSIYFRLCGQYSLWASAATNSSAVTVRKQP